MRFLILLAAFLLGACGAADASTADEAAQAPGHADAAVAGSGADMGAGVPQPAGDIALTVAATVDGRRYSADGTGECRHAGEASIYGMPSAMWLVQYVGGGDVRSVSLTLWRPKSGAADQLSLSIATANGSRRIATVQGGEIAGDADATLELENPGGRIVVDGEDDEGTPIHLELRCAGFATLEAVGG